MKQTLKKINELNKIKKVETNGKRVTESQKKILSLFDDLKTIFNVSKNEIESVDVNENKNESENVSENESENDIENESDDKNEKEKEKEKYYYEIIQLNNWFETIHQTKSLEEQIELLKEKGEFLSEYWNVGYYHGNKELNYKIFKAKAAYVLNDITDNSFEKIFGCKFATLVDKLINTTSKEENQIIIDNTENNSSKIIEQEYSQFVIQPAYKRGDLKDAVKIILEINELLTSDKVNND